MVRRCLATGFSMATKALTFLPSASITTRRTVLDYATRSLASNSMTRSQAPPRPPTGCMIYRTTILQHQHINGYAGHAAAATATNVVLGGAQQRFAHGHGRGGTNKQNKLLKRSKRKKPVANLQHTLTASVGQTRAERIKELRDIAKEKILEYEDLYRKKFKNEKLPAPPPDAAHHLLQYLDNPIPNDIKNSKEGIIDYILNVFLVNFRTGARLRKLQRDIAFRMDTKDLYIKNKKLQYEKILPIIGEMERAGQIKIRLGKQGRLILYKPSEAQLAVDVLTEKIDTVMSKYSFKDTKLADAAGEDDDDDDDKEENDDDDDEDNGDHAKDKNSPDDDDDDFDSDKAEEKLELTTKDERRRYGLEDLETDWIEVEVIRKKKGRKGVDS